MIRRLLAAAVLLVVALLPACTMKQLVADNLDGVLVEVERSYRDEASWQHGREAGAGLLKLLDGIIACSPENEDLLLLGARLNAQFAFAFLGEEEADFGRALYRKARDYGLRALDDPELLAAVSTGPDAVRARLDERDAEDAELLLWTGIAIAGWIDLNRDSISAVADLPSALVFIERSIALDETLFFGGAHLVLGRYHGSRGATLGGDPGRARAEFEKAFEISGRRLLLAQVELARYDAVPRQDRARFVTLLEGVLAAPDDILPGERLLTAIAKHRADELLLAIDDWFIDSEGSP